MKIKSMFLIVSLVLSGLLVFMPTSTVEAVGVTVSLSPTIINVNPPGTQKVDILISGVPTGEGNGLSVWELKVTWDPFVIKATKADITEGTFLSSVGATTFLVYVSLSGQYAMISSALNDPTKEASGAGTLASITFTILDSGESTIDLSDVQLWKKDMSILDPKMVDAYYYSSVPKNKYTVTPPNPFPNQTTTFDATGSY